ncbi:hypothetical protein THAOC_25832, partial [Thalassiosira oceanica]
VEEVRKRCVGGRGPGQGGGQGGGGGGDEARLGGGAERRAAVRLQLGRSWAEGGRREGLAAAAGGWAAGAPRQGHREEQATAGTAGAPRGQATQGGWQGATAERRRQGDGRDLRQGHRAGQGRGGERGGRERGRREGGGSGARGGRAAGLRERGEGERRGRAELG